VDVQAVCLEYEIIWHNTENNLAVCVERVKMLRRFNDKMNMKGCCLVRMYNVWYLVRWIVLAMYFVSGSSVSPRK